MSEPRRLPKRERQKRILEKLRASNDLWIPGLVTALDDVRHMHQEGQAERMALSPANAAQTQVATRRQKLAALAMRAIQPHMVVMIDGGATALDLARRMAADARQITAITNNLPAATMLGANPTIEVMFCPGRYDGDRGTVDGADTVRFLSRFRANLAIIGACGITAQGPNSAHADAAAVKRAMLERAEERILLLDRTKFGNRNPHRLCPLEEIDRLICDERPDAALSAALSKARVEVQHLSAILL
jgi:DeoR/GlpR family transcriptional regulator of sugar metabolism